MPAGRKHLIVIGGPTASGKTDWAVRLARHFGTAIISADSRQFFREMSIGTAKASAEERRQAPHHFIDNLSIRQAYSVGDFEREGLALLKRLFKAHDVVILAGGSGLYIQALCEGLDKFPEVPLSVRREVEAWYEQEGLEKLQEALYQADPDYYREVDLSNPARLIRALSVCRTAGRPFSSFRSPEKAVRPFVPVYLQLHRPRAQLYERIDRRVDRMLETGLIDEARRLYPYRNAAALQTVGYQELFDLFDGRSTYDEAVRLIKRNSRRYAKRQLTWMRRDGHWKYIGPDDWEVALDYFRLVSTYGLSIGCRSGNSPGRKNERARISACLLKDHQMIAAIPLYHGDGGWLLDIPPQLTDLQPAVAAELLIHQAVHCSEFQDCHARVNPDAEPLLRKYGFQRVGTLPAGLRDKIPGLSPASDSLLILFREGLQKSDPRIRT